MKTVSEVAAFLVARPVDDPVADGRSGAGMDGKASGSGGHPARVAKALAEAVGHLFGRLAGRRRSTEARFAHLLLLQRHAVEAEARGQPKRADFFWRECLEQLRAGWDEPALWQAGARRDGISDPDAGAALDYRRRAVDALFIDSHLGFYNGMVAQAGPDHVDERAFVHIRQASALAALAGYGPRTLKSILVAPGELQVRMDRAAGNFKRAMATCRQLLDRFPDLNGFGTRLAALHSDAALQRIGESTVAADCAIDAAKLAGSLASVRADLQRYPGNADLYGVAAELELIRSVKLANSRQLAEALVAIKWAQAYAPGQEQAVGIEARLVADMQALQESSKEVLAQLGATAHARLTGDGQRLVAEARRGFSPAHEAVASLALTTARRLGEEARRAQAGAAPDKRTWHAEADRAPMRSVDPAGAGARPGRDREPLRWWLASRQDLAAKAAAAGGVCVLLVAAVSAHQQSERRATRAHAYAALADGAARNSDATVIRAAESFLDARTWGRDGREPEVLQRYQAAFARWFANAGHTLDGPARMRVEQFRRLVPARTGSDEVTP